MKDSLSENSWVKNIFLEKPSLDNNIADADRLAFALKSELKVDYIDIDFNLLKEIPYILRDANYNVSCVLFNLQNRWSLAGIVDIKKKDMLFGLAVDLGTTRVVMRLLNLACNEILIETAFDNPQIKIAPDILNRIHYADSKEGLCELKSLITDGWNENIALMCKKTGMDSNNIHLVSVAGNTAMTHLFLGIVPKWIIREPYIPVVNVPALIRASEIGINISPFAKVFVFPNIGSYFGGDLIAGILYSGIYKKKETSILVDVGTNAEVVLGNSDWLVACAGAAGPALEGGVTKIGMMAAPGVIDRVIINPETLEFNIHTIDEKTPVGICGSGLIDLCAQLFLSGILDIRGKFIISAANVNIQEQDGIKHLILVPKKDSKTGLDLTISQIDIDSLIRSKAAMFTILETIVRTVGVSLSEIATFYVAGTFGSFINPKSAISIGMLPDLCLDSYVSIGNSSLEGATIALFDNKSIEELNKIRDQITYIELNVNHEFMNRFSAAKFLPHTDRSKFPSVKSGSLLD